MKNLEEFVPIKGYEGAYEINRNSVVRSLFRVVKCGNVDYTVKQYILKHSVYGSWYPAVNLCLLGKCKTKKIHKLVAEAFIPNPENKKCINHINGIKADNRIENLEWVTYKENSVHAHDSGLIKTRKMVICTETGVIYKSTIECAKMNNIKQATLSTYLMGKNPNKTTFVFYEEK